MRVHPVVLVPQDTTSLNELFTLARDRKSPRLLVRACQGRRRKVSTEAGRLSLWKHMQALPVAGHMSVDIPRRGRHEARTALLSVRFGPLAVSTHRSYTRACDSFGPSANEPSTSGNMDSILLMLLASSKD